MTNLVMYNKYIPNNIDNDNLSNRYLSIYIAEAFLMSYLYYLKKLSGTTQSCFERFHLL